VLAAVAAVHDGFVLQKATTRAPLGGSLLTQATLRAAEVKAPVLPRSVVRRVEKTPGNWEVRLRATVGTPAIQRIRSPLVWRFRCLAIVRTFPHRNARVSPL